MAELAIIENLQRKDLNALEKAASFNNYLSMYGCTHEELAARLSLDRSTISNLIRLLELPQGVQQALHEGAISAGHARALLPLADEARQLDFCTRIQKESLSVRAIEQLVHDATHSAPSLAVVDQEGQSHPVEKATSSEHLSALEQQLRSALGAKVQISQSAKGRGKIVVHFANHDEFNRLHQFLTSANMPQSQVG